MVNTVTHNMKKSGLIKNQFSIASSAIHIAALLCSIYFFASYIFTDLYYEDVTDIYFFPACLIVAVIFPLIFKDSKHNKSFTALAYTADLTARCFLCYILFLYSIKKIEGNMFSVSLHDLDTPLGMVSGFTLAWRFLGFNWKFDALIAASQIIIGFLLLFGRTKYLGALLSFLMFTFILSINVFIGIHIIVPVIVFALLSVYILRPVLYNLFSVLLLNQATAPVVQLSSAISAKSKKITRILLTAFILATTLVSLYNEKVFRSRFTVKSQLFGGWRSVTSITNPPDTRIIDKMYVEEANACVIKDDKGKLAYGNLILDTLHHEMSVTDESGQELIKGMYSIVGDTLNITKDQRWQFVRFSIMDKGHYADIYSFLNN